ncbi:TIGR00645 family protein [Pseudoxanthomonas daejeonensis]
MLGSLLAARYPSPSPIPGPPMSAPPPPRLGLLPTLIFASRWLQLPLYLGLIVAQCVYVFLFGKELWHLIHRAPALGEQEIMLIVLGLIDVVMISNLLMMVIVGGYETFVSRLRLEGHPDQPEWLSHVNASMLKVKLAMAIIGISSIHLLKTFIAAGSLKGLPFCTPEQLALMKAEMAITSTQCTQMTPDGVLWQTIIHCVFILSAIGIAWTDRLMTHVSKPGHASH